MKTIRTISEIRKSVLSLTNSKKSVGFVPTMGFLHEGHLQLIKKCKLENDVTVVSIFVNPTQFGDGEDFSIYPRDIQHDIELLESYNVDILFAPKNSEMYPAKQLAFVEVKEISKVLCGKSRPVHFTGVATIVLKLFNIINPSTAYFGQKDAQQLIIIKKMVSDLNLDIQIKSIPIVREKSGLAISSRNSYLSETEKKISILLSKVLSNAKKKIEDDGITNPKKIKKYIKNALEKAEKIKIDYIEIRKLDDLKKPDFIDNRNCLVAAAIFIGNVRLIDNIIFGEI